jgi:hypothetical protein
MSCICYRVEIFVLTNIADLFMPGAVIQSGMKEVKAKSARPDVDAAVRGGDWSQPMDGEGAPQDGNISEALYWRQIYTEILAMEEKVLVRIRELMLTQSDQARREVELTNIPVVVAQAERFRQRLGYWEARVLQLDRDDNKLHQHSRAGEF